MAADAFAGGADGVECDGHFLVIPFVLMTMKTEKPSAPWSAMAGVFRFCYGLLAAGSLRDGHGNSRNGDELGNGAETHGLRRAEGSGACQ